MWLPDQLARFRASVRLVAGWETRSAKRTLDPRWLVCHHTASVPWSTDAANRSVVVNGNAVAPGPISQTLVQRDGTVEVVAAGSSNNAGAGRLPDGGTDGNAQPGIEAVNAGAGMAWTPGTNRVQYGGSVFTMTAAYLATWNARIAAGELVRDPSTGMWWEVWSEQQLVGYAANCAAICDHFGWSADRLVAHATYAPLRKVDPAGPWFDDPTRPLAAAEWMARFRGLVQLVLDQAHQPPPIPDPPIPNLPPPEEDDMAALAAVIYYVDQAKHPSPPRAEATVTLREGKVFVSGLDKSEQTTALMKGGVARVEASPSEYDALVELHHRNWG